MKTRILSVGKRDDLPHWHILRVDNHPKELLLYHNWCNRDQGGCPKEGEEVEFEVSASPTYSSTPEYDFVHEFRRVTKEGVSEAA